MLPTKIISRLWPVNDTQTVVHQNAFWTDANHKIFCVCAGVKDSVLHYLCDSFGCYLQYTKQTNEVAGFTSFAFVFL